MCLILGMLRVRSGVSQQEAGPGSLLAATRARRPPPATIATRTRAQCKQII